MFVVAELGSAHAVENHEAIYLAHWMREVRPSPMSLTYNAVQTPMGAASLDANTGVPLQGLNVTKRTVTQPHHQLLLC